MKLQALRLVTLAALGALAQASVVHVDITDNDDVVVDISVNGDEETIHSNHDAHQQPVSTGAATTDDEYLAILPYEKHRGFLSSDSKYVNFSNIPYALPPVGELRFSPPEWISNKSDKVNEGSQFRICPQVQVGWVPKAKEFVDDYYKNKNLDKWKEKIDPSQYPPIESPPPGVDEDCLLLDVLVPKSVWDKRKEKQASVLVWIHGGGFIYGWKTQYGSPAGLLELANSTIPKDGDESDNIIFVSINYRLGAFGWLGGEQFMDEGGYPNLGLHDQQMALEWVATYISEFGGDPSKITTIGQSAGAASILHHLTWLGGRYQWFQKGIIQSPGFFPQPAFTPRLETTYKSFLNLTGAKDLEDLKTKDTKALLKANEELTYKSPYGYFNFGPSVDGIYVSSLPSIDIKNGRFNKNIHLLLGHTKDDGILFTPPWIRSDDELRSFVQTLFPNITKVALDKIANFYPINATDDKGKIAQVSDLLDDVSIQCNNYYLSEAKLKLTRPFPFVFRYVFNVPPAVHAADVPYTFYPSIKPLLVAKGLAQYMQTSFLNFARYIVPDFTDDDNAWPLYYTTNRSVMNFGNSKPLDFTHLPGPDEIYETHKAQCEFFQDGPFDEYHTPSAVSRFRMRVQINKGRMELKR